MAGEPRGGVLDCQPPEQACRRGGISKILEMTAKAAATMELWSPITPGRSLGADHRAHGRLHHCLEEKLIFIHN